MEPLPQPAWKFDFTISNKQMVSKYRARAHTFCVLRYDITLRIELSWKRAAVSGGCASGWYPGIWAQSPTKQLTAKKPSRF
uniref:Uncharacterized protein n=1 Tax=Colletotrichum destructivum TaxID=34406 RepID=A0AAX4IQB0_9PEZI|nr:hypothetical protein CDEST_09967 [Colletotrichum destructivum]